MDAKDRKIERLERLVAEQAATIEKLVQRVDELDRVWDYTLSACPDCGGKLDPGDKAPKVVQQVEIVEKPIRIDEHRGLAYWCSACQKIHYAPFLPEVEKGQLLGPRLTVLFAYMKGVCHSVRSRPSAVSSAT